MINKTIRLERTQNAQKTNTKSIQKHCILKLYIYEILTAVKVHFVIIQFTFEL